MADTASDSRKRVGRWDDDDDDGEKAESGFVKRSKLLGGEKESTVIGKSKLYHLDQIQRAHLDFDFEKVCSVTLSPRSVYCCLVCGKFFQGRSKGSPLFLHAVEAGHFVAMNLQNANIYVLPGGEQVQDSSLDDIKYNLHPTFTKEDLMRMLSFRTGEACRPALRDLHGNRYFPGLIGLNDLGHTDFVNSVIQCLIRVPRLRDFFLLRRSDWEISESRVTRAFGDLCCQLFNAKRFKHTSSPHELVQAIVSSSKFQVGTRADASQFLAWLLFELHRGCGGTKRPMSSIVHECFQGEVRVETTVTELKREFGEDLDEEERRRLARMQPGPSLPAQPGRDTNRQDDRAGDQIGTFTRAHVVSATSEQVPFLFLSLDLPTNPIFTDALTQGETVIPRTTLLEVLSKYDGETTVDVALAGGRLERKRYRVTRLPECLVFHLKRFTKNQFFTEKNRAVVSLPLASMDMAPYVDNSSSSSSMYNLIANVCHDGGVGPGVKDAIADGTYRANVYYPPQDSWFECQDLSVRPVPMPQLVSVSETFLAFYERTGNSPSG